MLLSRKPMRRLIMVIGTTLPISVMNSAVPLSSASRHAPVGDVDDVGLELGHALGDQLGKDGAPVQRVHGWIGGGERLCASVTEGKTAGETGIVAVEQKVDVRREVLDAAGRLRHELERADGE